MDKQYQDLLKDILSHGKPIDDRTGVGRIGIPGAMLKHHMSDGFPALTVRKISYKSVRVELEGFINGISSKKWYQERGCKFWDEWCNPQVVPYGNDPETKERMKAEDDLGFIYGNNWRCFVGNGYCAKGVDQLKNLVETLKTDPNSSRMLVSAWNPLMMGYAALPACHDSWQVMVIGGELHLVWRQRSVDSVLGLPANIASYGTLLHLLALETGLKEGYLIGHLGHVHVYRNQVEAANEYIKREPFDLPTVETEGFTSIFEWDHRKTRLIGYQAHDRVDLEVAV